MMPGASDDDPGRPGRPGHDAARPRRRKRDLPRLQHRRRRGRRGRQTVRRRRTGAAAPPARPAAVASAERHRPARQPAAAPAAGEADPRLGVRSRRGHPRRRRGCRASSTNPVLPLSYKQEQETEFRDTVVTLADRQFRLDARPADHGGGDERRHPGAHARALRRQGRDPRLHDARLEGRAGARALDRRRQAAPIPAGSTICATSSTSRPTRRGGAPGAISG